jgi:signal transduction histidine kinase
VVGDRGLAALRPGRQPQHLRVQEHYAQKGLGVLVDREGSLWVAQGRGVFQFPEPDTVAWTANDGLHPGNMGLARTAEGIWVTFWNWGLGIIEEGPEGQRARMVGQPAGLALCVSGRGTLWGTGKPPGRDERHLMSRSAEGGFRFHGRAPDATCGTAPDGSVWVTSIDGIEFISASDQVVPLGPARGPAADLRLVAPREDAAGTLWAIDVGGSPGLCRAPAAELRAGRRPVWQCLPLPGDARVEDMAVAPSGALWIGTRDAGLIRYDGKSVATLPGSRDLPSSNVHVVEPGRDGSVWVSGAGYLWRVRERTDLAAGWSVEERLGPAQGVMADGAFAVIEEEDGTVWATTAAGVIQVPASARAAPSSEPRLHLLRAAVNGRPVDAAQAADVPYGTNDVAVEISSLLFRDPASLLYRVRLAPDASWSAPVRPSRIQLVDVPPGRYGLEVSTSRDGAAWTPAQMLFRFAVGSPWYARPWVWMIMAAGALLAVVSVQRARLGLRLRLERQRTQIALDLHDEMGSGLGSIRVLAGMAARGTVDAQRQQLAAARIERTARDLGQALTGIVWSLRDSGRTLRDLCAHVAERGHELFPEEAPAFETAFPAEWPAAPLPLQTRRNLQLILMEALHNAAQ